MYFGYALIKDSIKGDKVELSLSPEKQGTTPLPIHLLPYTESALCFLSQEEAILVKPDEDSSLVIEPQKPAKIYLTPNRPEKPGFSVSKVRILKNPSGGIKCFFDREKGWEEFKPNTKEY